MSEQAKLKPLRWSQHVSMNCGVELFFAKDGKIIPADKVLSVGEQPKYDNGWASTNNGSARFTAHGVQAKLAPFGSTCRAGVGNDLRYCFADLKNKTCQGGITAEFLPYVELDEKSFEKLSNNSKSFGMAETENAYVKGDKKTVIAEDPKKFRGRIATGPLILYSGTYNQIINPQQLEMYQAAVEIVSNDQGYIHNYLNTAQLRKKMIGASDVLVPVLDIIVGNTCVLIDRNPANKERRKLYGKAGEFYRKQGGIEYHTLSNFWLRSYQLASFVMSLGRLAYHLVEQSRSDNDYVKALFDAVKREDVAKAINENDFDLAMKNFRAIEDILTIACKGNFGNYPFSKGHMNHFYYFVSKGLDHWFEKDILNHWATLPEGHGHGWERWLEVKVAGEYEDLGIDLNDPKYKDVKAETDIQDYVNGYGGNYKPLLHKKKAKDAVETTVATVAEVANVKAVPPQAARAADGVEIIIGAVKKKIRNIKRIQKKKVVA